MYPGGMTPNVARTSARHCRHPHPWNFAAGAEPGARHQPHVPNSAGQEVLFHHADQLVDLNFVSPQRDQHFEGPAMRVETESTAASTRFPTCSLTASTITPSAAP